MTNLAFIDQLDDEQAVTVLNTIAKVHIEDHPDLIQPSPELNAALLQAFNVDEAHQQPSEGELARAALQLLAQEPQFEAIIRDMAEAPTKRTFELATTGVITAAALLFALQSHIKISYKDGKWEFLFEKNPTDKGLLSTLVQGIASWWKEDP